MNRLISLLCLLLSACAGTTQFQSYPGRNPASTSTATVHVVRSNSAFGAAINAPVYVDRFLIGRIGPGGLLTVQVPVGQVHVTSTTADAVVQAKENNHYYFEVSMPAQMWFYAPDFNVIEIDRSRAVEVLGFDPRIK